MSDYYPSTKTLYGYECKLYKKPLPGKRCNNPAKCSYGGYCRSCDACGMTVEGFVYHSSEKDWDFHLRCAELPYAICSGGIIFTLKKKGPSQCLWCKERLLPGTSKNIPGWSYVSDEMRCSIHVHCVKEMAKQHNYTTSTNTSSNSSNSSLALQNVELGRQLKPKRSSNERNKWIEIFKIFLRTVISILVGDPTTILVSGVAHLLTEGFFRNNG